MILKAVKMKVVCMYLSREMSIWCKLITVSAYEYRIGAACDEHCRISALKSKRVKIKVEPCRE